MPRNQLADVTRAIETRATAVLDTSILFDYLLSFYDKNQDPYRKKVLQCMLPLFGKLIITPHALAELCNLANRTRNKRDFLETVAPPLKECFEETHVAKDAILNNKYFSLLGATDVAGLLCCDEDKHLDAYLLTQDQEAVSRLRELNDKIITYSDLFTYFWNNFEPR